VTSEGNARKCVASTPLHVAVAGVEKVVPTVDDLEAFVQLLARSATGQAQSAYLSLFTPPLSAPSVDFDRPDEPIGTGEVDRAFHLVLLDNGRFDLRDDDELRETLYCIRCSACANSCANFQHVGGHAFGGETYSGGIATGWEAGVHGLASAGSFNDLCTGCTRCAPNCPVKIDIPWINTVVRDRLHRVGDDGRFDSLVDGLTPGDASAGLDARLFARVDRLLALASAAAPVSNWLAGTRPVRALLERTVGIDPRRPLPRVAREPFSAWAADRSASPASADVVLYPDVYTEYLGPARGRAALRLLEALGLEVAVPSVPESGRAAFSQGLVEPSRDRAEAVEATLRPHLTAGRPVVAIEPSDLAMFRREYARLLPEGQANRVAAGTFDLLEFVEAHLGDRPPAAVGIPDGDGRRAVYHPHCQGRTLGLAEPTVSLLERCGYEVSVTSAECCGMAGSFGYTVDHYDLSVAVGESLVEEVAAHDPEVVLASGTSCLEQLEHLGERQPRHPVHVLDPAG
ncbi:MAG: LUD domain-containing protein, partial [Halobacteriota archaeon]